MGDRAHCRLMIKGLLYSGHVDAIIDGIDEGGGAIEGSYEVDDLKEALLDGDNNFEFEEMNYGDMPSSLDTALKEAKLAYTWEWEAGGGFGAGVTIYDPFAGEEAIYATSGGEIVLTLEKARSPEAVSEATKWEEMSQYGHLAVYTSNHDLLRLQADSEVDPRFFGLHQKASDAA